MPSASIPDGEVVLNTNGVSDSRPVAARLQVAAVASSQHVTWVHYAFFIVTIVALVGTLVIVAVLHEKQQYRNRASVATQNTAALLDRQTSAVFETLGPRGAVTIRNADLALVFRYPSLREDIGTKNVSQELQHALTRL